MKVKNQVLIIVCLFIGIIAYSQKISNQNAFIYTELTQLNTNPNYLITNNSNLYTKNVNESIIKLNQEGNYNNIDLKTSLNDSQTVSQLGNKNNYTFINYYNANPSNFNVLQQGTSNFLEIYGQNSIINNISIIQKSSFKTIQIINY